MKHICDRDVNSGLSCARMRCPRCQQTDAMPWTSGPKGLWLQCRVCKALVRAIQAVGLDRADVYTVPRGDDLRAQITANVRFVRMLQPPSQGVVHTARTYTIVSWQKDSGPRAKRQAGSEENEGHRQTIVT